MGVVSKYGVSLNRKEVPGKTIGARPPVAQNKNATHASQSMTSFEAETTLPRATLSKHRTVKVDQIEYIE